MKQCDVVFFLLLLDRHATKARVKFSLLFLWRLLGSRAAAGTKNVLWRIVPVARSAMQNGERSMGLVLGNTVKLALSVACGHRLVVYFFYMIDDR